MKDPLCTVLGENDADLVQVRVGIASCCLPVPLAPKPINGMFIKRPFLEIHMDYDDYALYWVCKLFM